MNATASEHMIGGRPQQDGSAAAGVRRWEPSRTGMSSNTDPILAQYFTNSASESSGPVGTTLLCRFRTRTHLAQAPNTEQSGRRFELLVPMGHAPFWTWSASRKSPRPVRQHRCLMNCCWTFTVLPGPRKNTWIKATFTSTLIEANAFSSYFTAVTNRTRSCLLATHTIEGRRAVARSGDRATARGGYSSSTRPRGPSRRRRSPVFTCRKMPTQLTTAGLRASRSRIEA